jgi:ribosomal protein S27E
MALSQFPRLSYPEVSTHQELKTMTTITARCPDCRNTEFNIPDHDDEQVTCTACGSEMGTKRACLDHLDSAAKEIGDSALGGFGTSGKGFKKQ